MTKSSFLKRTFLQTAEHDHCYLLHLLKANDFFQALLPKTYFSNVKFKMPQCAVVGCNNTHRRTKGGSVKYHRFPGDSVIRHQWLKACGKSVNNCATARICSRHFRRVLHKASNESGNGNGVRLQFFLKIHFLEKLKFLLENEP